MQCKSCKDSNSRPLQMSSSHEQDYYGLTFYWTCRQCKRRVKSCRVEFANPAHVANYPHYEEVNRVQ